MKDLKDERLPVVVTTTNKIFSIISNQIIVWLFALLSVPICYLLDSYWQESQLLPEVGAVLTILGLLLTIKHRFVKDGTTFKAYHDSYFGIGRFAETHITDQDAKKIKSIAIQEASGFWLIIIGTLINVFSDRLPLLDFLP